VPVDKVHTKRYVRLVSSGSAPPKQDGRRAEARGTARERLLDAAAQVFAERGYRAASVEDIASAAGVTKGAVYWSFESKEDLFFALMEERVDRRARELMGVTEHAPREIETAPLISRGISSIVDEQQALVLLIQEYWAVAVRDEELRERYVQRQRALRDHLAHALEARHRTTGVPLAISAELLATGIIGLATGLAQERIADPEAVPEDLLGELLSLLYDGLVRRAEAAR
jgi:AcrR family transcriptional regulator